MRKLLYAAIPPVRLSLVSCSNNPYVGVCYYYDNSNIMFTLNNDDFFVLAYDMNKINEYIYGKYHIEDNNIKLKFNNMNFDKLFKRISSGKVEGSRINLSKSEFFYFQRE
jgi:hypothetical protein